MTGIWVGAQLWKEVVMLAVEEHTWSRKLPVQRQWELQAVPWVGKKAGAPGKGLGTSTDPSSDKGHGDSGAGWGVARHPESLQQLVNSSKTPDSMLPWNGCTDCEGIKAQGFLCWGPSLEAPAPAVMMSCPMIKWFKRTRCLGLCYGTPGVKPVR